MADTEWAIVANVRAEAFGNARSPGTRHFSAGALVWCLEIWRDLDFDRVRVLGRHRGSARRVAMKTSTRYLVNFRAKLAYEPFVVRTIREHHAQRDETACHQIAMRWAALGGPRVDDVRARADRLRDALRLFASDDGKLLVERATALIPLHGAPSPVTPELEVLGDFLEEHGAGMPLAELATLLRRRRDNA